MSSLWTRQQEVASQSFQTVSQALDLDSSEGDVAQVLKLYHRGMQLIKQALDLRDDTSPASRVLTQKLQRNLEKVITRIDELQSAEGVPTGGDVSDILTARDAEDEGKDAAGGSWCSTLTGIMNAALGMPAGADGAKDGAVATRTRSKSAGKKTRQLSRSNELPADAVAAPRAATPTATTTSTSTHPGRPMSGSTSPMLVQRKPAAARMPSQPPPQAARAPSRQAQAPAGGGGGANLPATQMRRTQQFGAAGGSDMSRQSVRAAVPAAAAQKGQQQQQTVDHLKGLDKKLTEQILNDVVEKSPPVTWDMIGGMEDVKQALYESVILPSLRPDLFRGLLAPRRGLLLFGPPGNGKTLIAKAVAHEAKATFFNISASTLTSKWVGEGEKLVRTLFALARHLQPTVVFIDEVDSLLTERTAGDNDAMRRLKTEFLLQFDGMSSEQDERLFVLGATNRPQDLDEAARRRFSKRIYVKLPDSETRCLIMRKLLQSHRHKVTDRQLCELAEATQGYSGSDLTELLKEAAMATIRELGSHVADVPADRVRPISAGDVSDALKRIRASSSPDKLHVYEEFNRQFGCVS